MAAPIEALSIRRQLKQMQGISTARGMATAVTARSAALDLIGAVLRQKHPLDEAIEDHAGLAELPARDRAFARLLVATVLRRLGQIDAMIAHCLEKPLPPRAALPLRVSFVSVALPAATNTPPP